MFWGFNRCDLFLVRRNANGVSYSLARRGSSGKEKNSGQLSWLLGGMGIAGLMIGRICLVWLFVD